MNPHQQLTARERAGRRSAQLLVTAVAAVALMLACTPTDPPPVSESIFSQQPASVYDPAAHRAELEALLGHPVGDWPRFVDNMRRMCVEPGEQFELTAAVAMDEVDPFYEAWRLSIRHMCPQRLPEVAAVEDEVDYVP